MEMKVKVKMKMKVEDEDEDESLGGFQIIFPSRAILVELR